MESILLWTGQNDQLQVMRMDHAGKKIAAPSRVKGKDRGEGRTRKQHRMK